MLAVAIGKAMASRSGRVGHTLVLQQRRWMKQTPQVAPPINQLQSMNHVRRGVKAVLLALSGGAALQFSVSGYAVCNGVYGDAPDSAGLSAEGQDRAAPASGRINHPDTIAAVEELVRALLVQWCRRPCCAQRPADTANTRRAALLQRPA